MREDRDVRGKHRNICHEHRNICHERYDFLHEHTEIVPLNSVQLCIRFQNDP